MRDDVKTEWRAVTKGRQAMEDLVGRPHSKKLNEGFAHGRQTAIVV